MEILRTENLKKSYGKGESKVVALDGVNLTVEKGQFLSIVGSSGSGKSTLLHILGGVDKPTEGKVHIEDREISTLKENELALFRRRKVGLIYQFYNLNPTIDIKKNMLLPVLLDGREPDMKYFEEIVHILGLDNRLNHYPGQLSGGQQQRVAIGRALIYRPAIVLADEPTGNLDRNNSNEIIELLKLSNRKYKQTILLITHDERMALQTDRIITLEDGNIISDEVIE
ncbi:MAG: ABC transporter ATP-binding protein [Tissierella sp.]|nr:ABC transporter ATP-binding protein [Tissierella sp.]